MHVLEGEKVPLPDVDHVTVPVGEYPPTLAEHVVVAPIVTDDGVQDTAVVLGVVTMRLNVPLLGAYTASPP